MSRFKFKTRFKITIVLLALVVVLSIGGGLGYAFFFGGGSVNLQKGLVGHWKMDGNAKDSTPNSNHGTVTGATLTTDRKGQANKAYSFNGTSDHISAGNAGSGIKTVTFWMQADVTASKKIIDIDGTDQIELDASSNIAATSFPGVTTIYIEASSASANIPDTNWHFVAITDATGVSASGFDMGAVSASYFDGKLDDVRVYNRALSSAEITALYESYNASVVISDLQKGLVGHWDFGAGSTTTATPDRTPNNNDGTVSGATLTTDRKGQSNKAYSFNGTTDYVNISGIDFPASGGTASIWFYLETEGSGRILWNDKNDNSDYIEVFSAGTIRLHTAPPTVSVDYTVPAISFNTWYHLVVTRSANNARVYLNGVESTSGEQSFTGILEIDQIGAYASREYPQFNWDGALDDARIYNRALSSAEISALYESYNPSVQISDLQKGLVGNWKMDGTAQDATPYNNDGTVTGATLTTDRKNQSNKAYSFNGTTDYIEVADTSSLSFASGGMSVSAWVFANDTTSRTIVSKYDVTTAAELREYLFYFDSGGALRFIVYDESVNATIGREYSGAVSTGVWHYVIATYDGSTVSTGVKIYLDGVQVDDTTNESGTFVAMEDLSLPVRIGSFPQTNGSQGQFFTGSIDDVRIYNRALSATEITALYESYR